MYSVGAGTGCMAASQEAAAAQCCLAVLVGLPGSGKSTLATQLTALTEPQTACPVAVHHLQLDTILRDLLQQGQDAGAGFDPVTWQAARHALLQAAQELLMPPKAAEAPPDPAAGTDHTCPGGASANSHPSTTTTAIPTGNSSAATCGTNGSRHGSALGGAPPGRRLVLLDDVHHLRSMRRDAFRLARKCGAAYLQLVVDTPQEEASRRNAARPPGQHIPPAVLSKLAAALELPPAAADMAGGGPAAGGGAGWEANTVWVTPDMSPASVWAALLDCWGPPPPPPADPAAEAARVAAERAATAQQLVHGWDLATRAALGRALAGVGQAARPSAAAALNTLRRQLLHTAQQAAAAADRGGADAPGVAVVFQRLQQQFLDACQHPAQEGTPADAPA